MFAIAFDLTVADADVHHSKGYKGAYADIRRTMGRHGFEWVQGSVYMSESDNLADIASVTEALKAMPWFPLSLRDIRVFRVENWSDFTPFMRAKV
jgi:virulence-associated protein VapD